MECHIVTSINASTVTFDSADELLNEALRNDANYINIAAYCCDQTRFEELLGQALTKILRQMYHISIKISRFELDLSRHKLISFLNILQLASKD
ncbi:hypothetical protein LOAG_13226 [Loa loa]|uniref:Uncharacterized protein n=2 Tax=Loa loa TaxID=7209 RepID=A0A1S0TJN8_LOALO|nr:hypothetical protein LOAG_13226 [Loa loa]EFO15286.2 hypothetical protein LOAG_13226 [Loa loa]